MRKTILALLGMALIWGSAAAQVTVTAPSSRDDVKACADYADETLLDRWDMNERTDLGWRIWNTAEMPQSYLGNILFQSGIFSCVSTSDDPNITILDSHYPGSSPLGKIGVNFPINASKYTRLVFRMYLGPDQGRIYTEGQLFWSKNTMYVDMTTSGSFVTYDGWRIYCINVPALGIAAGSATWSGNIDSLRMDPISHSDRDIRLDWIRLVEYDSGSNRTITWSGSSSSDIYLDNDTNWSNGTLGVLAKSVSGLSYAFLAGGLAPGDYYVAVCPAGTSNYDYSSGYYHVNDVPIVVLNSPSDEGSDTDFITTNFSDPWDMANSQDIEHTEYLQNPQFTTLSYEDLKGTAYSNQTVFKASSVSGTGSGDPQAFFLHFLYRGGTAPIDTAKYNHLTFKTGIWGAQSVNDGSIARVIWRNTTETVENVCEDIIIRHLPNKWVMQKVVADMTTLPHESDPGGSPSYSGWTGYADCFRIDPHEFTPAREFFFDDVKLASDIKANASYTITWALSDSDHSPTVALYRDTDGSGYNGTLIASLDAAESAAGSYTWNTSGVSAGTYWIYAVTTDGTNTNRCYSRGHLKISHTEESEIRLSKKKFYMACIKNGVATSQEEVLVTNGGLGTLDWTATPENGWVTVTPSSGTGNGKFRITFTATDRSVGNYTERIRVEDPNASNSPQVVEVYLTVFGQGGDTGPLGCFDTPTEGSTVSGSIAVTGWAMDDIEVKKVEIKRDPDSDDPAGAIGADGLVYIGDAVFVKGARPDIESLYPTYPKADRAGWGYMMLTYGLPRRGNGTFRLYAIAEDVCGRRQTLGTKTITSDNNSRTKPFGTIDTPDQGGIASGTDYVVFGWALTPLPGKIPEDGHTIWLSIDSVFIGNPVYNQYREDVHDGFPEYANADGAVGYYHLNTTAYADGVHTIGWLVTDDLGRADGMGSRFFEIQNMSGATRALSRTKAARAGSPLGLIQDFSGALKVELPGPSRMTIEELQRIEIPLKATGGKRFIGWGASASKPLPIGSTLDQKKGVFYWAPGPGFLGKHVLHFAVADGRFRSPTVTLVVNIVPKTYVKKAARR